MRKEESPFCPITTEFALFLEAALGVNADLLVRMQTDYNIQVARKNNSLREKLNNIKKIASLSVLACFINDKRYSESNACTSLFSIISFFNIITYLYISLTILQ